MGTDRHYSRPYRPLFVIGAARSGTKLIRDLLGSHPLVDEVPYDINYVWRFGNENVAHDQLSPATLTSRMRRRIVRHLARYSSGAPFLVEKTVSNCLRIPYVNAVFAEAEFIHLVRDGRDVVESAFRRWLAPLDWRYVLGKAMTFPLRKAPGYALSYVWTGLRKSIYSNRGDVGTWGPRYKGIDEDVSSKGILETCAIQWARCVDRALRDLRTLPGDRVLTVRYEDFVREPRSHLTTIVEFVGLPSAPYANADLSKVTQDHIGKGRRRLSHEQMDDIRPHIEGVLSELRYE